MLPSLWPAPAKINLFLHIVGKRDDGYHNLQTVFQFLDYADKMSFDLNNQGRITRSYDLGFDEEEDLCLRAAKILQPFTKPEVGVTIGLNKRLPIGAGLGGGSSNAATTLIALNHLWEVGLRRQKLAELGLTLGADVPVFVHGQAAWAEGVGEQLTPIDLPQPWYVVLTPQIEVSTAQVFADKRLTAAAEMLTIRAFQEGHGENQFEPIVRAEYSEIDALLKWLNSYSDPAFGKSRMSGSGGSVFMPVADRDAGQKILAEKPTTVSGFVAKGLNQHPLLKLSSLTVDN